MKQYLDLVKEILEYGDDRVDRTKTGTIDLFGPQMTFNLMRGFPLMTTKKIDFNRVLGELIWILRGSCNNDELRKITFGEKSDKKTIWEPWASKENGDLGPVYGKQLRGWEGKNGMFDQLDELMINLRDRPFSRRHVVSLWNAADLPDESRTHEQNLDNGFAVLPPCHCLFQFYVIEKNGTRYLSCKMYQRSADMFIGVPYNIASYAALTELIAHQLGYVPYQFIHTFGSAHVYSNHIEQFKIQLNRTPSDLPQLSIKKLRRYIWDYEVTDFELHNYNPQSFIKAQVAI